MRPTPNPNFRRVDAQILDYNGNPIVTLSTIVGLSDRRRMMRSTAGFSEFIEVLVAMTVMAVMAVMAWQGVDGIVRARDANQGRLQQTLRLNRASGEREQDLGSIQESGWCRRSNWRSRRASTVRLTRRAEGGLQVVAWALGADATSSSWWRWASPIVTTVGDLQDSWLRTQQFQGGEPGQLLHAGALWLGR